MSKYEIFYADDLTDFDENGNIIMSETSIRQAKFIDKIIDDIKSGKVKINMSDEVFNPDDEKYYPRWQEDENFIYVLDEITFTYLPLIEVSNS